MVARDLRPIDEAEIVADELAQPRPLYGVAYPPQADRSNRRHIATLGPAAYSVERDDTAQPLRTYVPEITRARAASSLLWMRVGVAGVATLVAVVALLKVLAWVLSW